MTTIISSKSAKITAGLVGLIAGVAMFAITAQAATFTTNLKQGSTGADVKNLQMVLNMSADTQVSVSGAGSPGNETSYFGPATKAAVVKFQNKYASEILAPVGLTSGTGYVGASTRAKLNTMEGGSTTSMVPGCTSTVGFSPTTGASCASGVVTTTTLVPGCTSTVGFSPTTGASCATGAVTASGPVSASLANDNPAASAVIAGQATADLLHVAFTGNGTITNVKLMRTGISANTTLSNVYLYNGNTRLSDAASVNNTDSTISFNGLNLSVNGSLTLSVKADIAAGTAGQIVGVNLIGYTTSGSGETTANISGNYMNIASAPSTMTAATAAANTVGSTATVNAGTTGFTFWSSPVTVTNRLGLLTGANFRYVGSAPADALENIRLYVNGVAAGATGVLNTSTNLVSFDFASSPVTLNTGASTIDVRADVVKGSNRTITISLANAADLMIRDSQLGVNVAVTNNSSTGTTVTINPGSVTASVDSTYNATTVAGGTTGAIVGQYTLKAYGEDVKVDTLKVTFATTSAITTLDNVALYANGVQVGSSANFLGTAALTFTLGSSLILPANTTVTLTVKADMIDSTGSAYTSGTVATVLGGVASNAQGQSSFETLSVASTAITGNTLTVGASAGTFVRTSGFVTSTSSPNTQNVKIGSFTLQAGSTESISVTSIGVKPTLGGYNGGTANAITNYSTLTVKNGSTVLGTPVGNPAAATSTFSFSGINIPINGSVTFDVYADIGGAASSTANPTITADMAVTYRGAVSNTTTTSAAAGVAIASASATLAAPTLVSSSAVAQYVVGGSSFGIATFKLSTAAQGTSATVNKLAFATTGQDAIVSITVGGVTQAVTGSGASATTTISGLNINVPYTGVDVPVTVKFSGFLGSTTGGSLSSGIASTLVTLSYVEGTSGTGAAITSYSPVSSNTMMLYASKPTVSGPSSSSGILSSGVQKIGEFTVAADTNGKIAVATTSITFSTSTTGTINVTDVKLSDDGGSTAIANSNTVAAPLSGTAFTIGFTTPYEISAGTSKTFSIYANVTGAYGASGVTSLSTALTSAATFLWNDVTTGSTGLTGTGIQNFGVGAYTLRN